ncbi:HlyD family efflux transporter periplasmic adaptor subunit [Leeia sp. TBRC 13508]|uniref:HlyD family efflux transporter periplasmic adaptor subunit n=1 Tax=Leeia speluncae TaxID=2884804 RepID=A0ABS8D3U0_9NEIS|nr:HlyD family efflux transporter periplasmic adaptor subunit [Leeia speluncae]MCB6182841.1 HlyD family efflux transporter periplasmic adaptor subunit [Leeia speluncae]
MTDQQQNATTPAPAENGKRKKALTLLTTLFVLAGIGYATWYTLVGSKEEETDDAYVGGNLITLTPQVAGTVVSIHADETQPVKAGQLLVQMDPSDSKVALEDARAKLGEAVRQIRQQSANAAAADAQIDRTETDLKKAKDDLARRLPLLKDQAITGEEVAHAQDSVKQLESQLQIVKKQAVVAHAAIDGTTLATHPSVLRARATFIQAWLADKRNGLVAPINGVVSKRSVQVGQRIAPGTNLMSIVPLDNLWIDANFKEKQLRNLRINQPVEITTDIYGSDVTYHGKILGFSAGTGAAFSLLPAQNATGNWIKVVQRVPVRIALDPKELQAHPLRIGLSTLVKVDTHERNGQVLAPVGNGQAVYQTQVYDAEYQAASKEADQLVATNAGVKG